MVGIVRPVCALLLLFTLLLGGIYPAVVTGIVRAVFPHQSQGSLIVQEGKTVGSELIGQRFITPRYFWGRPSAVEYNAATSGGSNLSVGEPRLKAAVQARMKALEDADPDNAASIPVDLVTASASGLDPHISPEAAHYQASRVAKARAIDEEAVHDMIARYTEGKLWGIFGEPVINVLRLNLALDAHHH